MQGVQVLTSVDDAWGGFAGEYVEELRDEYGKLDICVWGMEKGNRVVRVRWFRPCVLGVLQLGSSVFARRTPPRTKHRATTIKAKKLIVRQRRSKLSVVLPSQNPSPPSYRCQRSTFPFKIPRPSYLRTSALTALPSGTPPRFLQPPLKPLPFPHVCAILGPPGDSDAWMIWLRCSPLPVITRLRSCRCWLRGRARARMTMTPRTNQTIGGWRRRRQA